MPSSSVVSDEESLRASLLSTHSFSRPGTGNATATSLLPSALTQLPTRAAAKFVALSTQYKSRAELQQLEQVALPRWVIHPHDSLARAWWSLIMLTVVFTLFAEPFALAYAHYPGLYPLSAPDTLVALLVWAAYSADVLLNFLVAYHDAAGQLVTDLPSIARHYAKSGRLAADLITTIPFDWILLAALGLQQSNSTLAWKISLLRLLRLGRAYRLVGWIQHLTYNQTFRLMTVTLVRNFGLAFLTVHWGASGFWFLAKLSGFGPSSWVGANMEWVGHGTAWDKWVYSMYWSIITFSTVGYGDLHAYSVAEAAYVVVFMFVSIGVAAYFVATTTVLVVDTERQTGQYRERLLILDDYAGTNDLPPGLKADMANHLRLQFASNPDASDAAVLETYPINIRRRLLRHLTNLPLAHCWLLAGTQRKFLDALLLGAAMETLLPQVEIVSAGDLVSELYILVSGAACAEAGDAGDVVLQEGGSSSVHDGCTTPLGSGDAVGAFAFFTEKASTETVRTQSVCRVLIIPRALLTSLAADHRPSMRALYDNLLERAEAAVARELPGGAAGPLLDELEEVGGTVSFTQQRGHPGASPLPLPLLGANGLPLRSSQQAVLANLLRVRQLVSASRARMEAAATNDFLHAAAEGAADRLRLMLQQGCDVNATDYDGRSGLMLAAGKGADGAVKVLLVAGGTVNQVDALGGSALLEAVKGGHESTMELLLWAGARLQLSELATASQLCSAVNSGDVKLLSRLLRAGAHPNAADYDRRSALHIAAAGCNLVAAKALVEAGASVAATDRWEQTPLDEARRVCAAPLVAFLAEVAGEQAAAESLERWRAAQAQAMLTAAAKGRLAEVQKLLERGCPPDAADYDRRTGLMLAAANGHRAVLSLLLAAGANPNARDNLGGSPLLEAVKGGRENVLRLLVAAGASLQLSASELSSALCSMVSEDEAALLAAYIAAGADVNAADYNRQTPLHCAARQGKLAMVQALVEAGGSVAAPDCWGTTPLQEAEQAGAADVVAYLQQQLRRGAQGTA